LRRPDRRSRRRHRPRGSVFEAGYATEAPGIQINRFCASGLDAINFGTAKIAQGADDIVIAGGVESMSRIGIGASGRRLVHGSVGQHAGLFHAAGHFRRPDRNEIRLLARRRRRLRRRKPEARGQSWEKGHFNKSVVPVKDINGLTILDRDEHMRPGTDMQALASLNPPSA
jgi:acetyl-CoA C-acetyltransferase